MYSSLKNSYLQSHYKDINPGLINRCVQKAWENLNTDEHDLEPPFNRLTSQQPCVPLQHFDVTRRPVGFGRWALPKLRRELHDKNPEVVLAAVESISDLVHDPERAFEAVQLKIIDRLVDLLLHVDPYIREAVCITLTTLAGILPGREAIVYNDNLLFNLEEVLKDGMTCVRMNAAALLEMTARFWKAADELLDFGFVEILLSSLLAEPDCVIKYHLETLHSLMYGSPGKGLVIESKGFDILVQLLDNENVEIKAKALECLADIASVHVGEKICREANLLEKIPQFLIHEDEEVHTNAVLLLMFCTIKTSQQIKVGNIPELTNHLVDMCKNSQNRRLQTFAIKALTNICHNPAVRKKMKEESLNELKTIQVSGDRYIKELKKLLLGLITWNPCSAK